MFRSSITNLLRKNTACLADDMFCQIKKGIRFRQVTVKKYRYPWEHFTLIGAVRLKG